MTELQITMKLALGEACYAEYVESATQHLAAVEGIDLESVDDLKAAIGWILKAQSIERAGHAKAFQERRALETDDNSRMGWIEDDLRRLLSIFRFTMAEGLTARQAIDWMAAHLEDAELPTEFVKAFGEASKEIK